MHFQDISIPNFMYIMAVLTCRVSLIDWPAVHLQGGITPTTSKSHHMILSITHNGPWLFDSDIICAHIKNHPHCALVLEEGTKKRTVS